MSQQSSSLNWRQWLKLAREERGEDGEFAHPSLSWGRYDKHKDTELIYASDQFRAHTYSPVPNGISIQGGEFVQLSKDCAKIEECESLPSISTFSDRICMDRWISVRRTRLQVILKALVDSTVRLHHYGGKFLYVSTADFPDHPEGAIFWIGATCANGFQHVPFEELFEAKHLFEATLHPDYIRKDTIHLFAGKQKSHPLLIEEITNGAIVMPVEDMTGMYINIDKALRSIEGYE